MKRLIYGLLLVIVCLGTIVIRSPAAEQMPNYELRFWPGANVEEDSRLIKLSEHPCGQVAIANVMKMPSLDQGQPLQPERVVELSQTGEVLHQWATPVDYRPIGIQDNRLLMELGEDQRLWIDVAGRISPAEGPSAAVAPKQVECANLTKEFPNSAYARCWQFQDPTQNQYRILGFESPCT